MPSGNYMTYLAAARLVARRTAFSADWGRFDRNEVRCRIQIVLARLVNYADLLMLRGRFIWNGLIQLSQLQRCTVASVPNANHELPLRIVVMSPFQNTFDLVLLHAISVSFVPVESRHGISYHREASLARHPFACAIALNRRLCAGASAPGLQNRSRSF